MTPALPHRKPSKVEVGLMAAPVALPGSSGLVSAFGSGGGQYMGFTVRETAGAVASFRLRLATVTGIIIEDVSLLANESVRDWYGPQGKYSNGDLYYQLIAGAVEGSVFVQ